jgi:hypothetical protein
MIYKFLCLFIPDLLSISGYEKRTKTGICGLFSSEEKNQTGIFQSDQSTN